jgi:putative transposase
MIKIKEYNTSSTCPHCGAKYHPKNRQWICPECNYKQHRDLVGAINILNFNTNYHVEKYNTFKYLQII